MKRKGKGKVGGEGREGGRVAEGVGGRRREAEPQILYNGHDHSKGLLGYSFERYSLC